MPCWEGARPLWEAPNGEAVESWRNAGDIWLRYVEPLAGPLAHTADGVGKAADMHTRNAKAMDLSLNRVAPLAKQPNDREAGMAEARNRSG
jgi:hypothetical protein